MLKVDLKLQCYNDGQGGNFTRFLQGTWVAPTSGTWLVRLVINCDVPFYADVQADGCFIDDDGTYGCQPTSDGMHNARCASQLQLTVTPGAYFANQDSQAGHRRTQMGGDHLDHTIDTHPIAPTVGTFQRTDIIVIERSTLEAQAATVWQATSADQRPTAAPPTLDEMLVSGTPANALLATMLTTEQQPHVAYPLSYVLDGSEDDGCGRRRLQHEGDRLYVTIETHAPSSADANLATQRLVSTLPGLQHAGICPFQQTGSCELTARTQTVNNECCDEPSEDCSSGRPATCNVGCARVVLPFFDDCSEALGKHASDFDSVVAMCHSALQGRRLQSDPGTSSRRQLQMGGDHLHQTIDDHAVCGLGSTEGGCTADGQTEQHTRLFIGRDDVEAIVRDKFATIPVQERTMQVPPTLDEMLVSGTPANALLSSTLIQEQQPLVMFPVLASKSSGACGRHRRLQKSGDRLYVTIETHAATPEEADAGVRRLASTTSAELCGSEPAKGH